MNNKKLLFFPFILFFLCTASAIVIVPPVVYLASISLLSIAFNMIAGLFFWIAVQGIAEKKFFGKPFSSIMAFLIPTGGKILFGLLLAIFFSILFNPVSLQEIIILAIIVSGIFFLCSLLSNFRKIRNSKQKIPAFLKVAVFSVAILLLVIVSVSLSVEKRQLAAYSTMAKEERVKDSVGIVQSALPFVAEKNLSEEQKATPSESGTEVGIASLWLVPENNQQCTLVAGSQLFSFQPQKNCFSENFGLQKTFCPIEILPSMIEKKGMVILTAGGSCSGQIFVTVKENSFEVAKK